MPKFLITDRAGRHVTVDAKPGISVMENIRDLDNSVEAICGGMCACATCHVYVEPDCLELLNERSYEEQVMLSDSAHFDSQRSRLSCQIIVTEAHEGLAFTIAPEE